jgi:hypothetical protein
MNLDMPGCGDHDDDDGPPELCESKDGVVGFFQEDEEALPQRKVPITIVTGMENASLATSFKQGHLQTRHLTVNCSYPV